MANTNKYKIFSSPAYRTVTPGAEVTYTCQQTHASYDAPGAPQDQCRWFCYNDRRAAEKHWWRRYISSGPVGFQWKDAEWDFEGKHTIQCVVTFTDGVKGYYEYPQWVGSVEAVLGALFAGHKKTKKLPNPFTQYSVVKRYVQVLEAAQKRYPLKETTYDDLVKKQKYEKRLKDLRTYRDELGKRLDGSWGKYSVPIYAVHLDVKGQQRTQLRATLVKMAESPGDHRWRLIDWTHPAERRLTGVYDGKGKSAEAAIRDAIAIWDSKNRYWTGKMLYEVPVRACGKAIKGTFDTDGASFWDSVSQFLSYIALGAAIVAGVITLVAPVPGARVISGMIWTSIFTSTASAVINIGQRHDEGFNDWKEDAFDTLSIVGNIFGGAWLRCARLSVKGAQNARLAKVALIGQVTTDGFSGLLIAVDELKNYDAIMKDQSLTPEERTQKLVALFRRLALSSAMTYMSVKGSAKDLAGLKADPAGVTNLAKLKDPAQTVEIEANPKTRHHTREKKAKVTANDEHDRLPGRSAAATAAGRQAQKAAKRVFQAAANPKSRGMRACDDKAFSKMASRKKRIIIPRNGNAESVQYIGKPGYKPKPGRLKCKTRKTPPNVGLASGDPSDPRLQERLKADGKTYQQYVDDLKADGYTVGSAQDGYVVRDAQGNAFYSDYDLHGVYDANTGADLYNEALRTEMNADLGEKLILHGPHDQLPSAQGGVLHRNKGSTDPLYGPQPPCTAYTPDGKAWHLETFDDMRAFYEAHNINFKGIYPNDDYPKMKGK